MQLEQCQLVRYNEKSGTLGEPFDEPKVSGGCCVCVCVNIKTCFPSRNYHLAIDLCYMKQGMF